MNIDLTELAKGDVYRLMIQTIVPRPIAWVLSDSRSSEKSDRDSFNLAPFSYFNGISSDPPTMMISVGKKVDGSKKDTWRNIEERDEFVIHIASPDLAEAVTKSAASLAHGESEIDAGGLELTEFDGSSLPRVVGPKIAMACRLATILEYGETPQGIIFGEIRSMWVDDAIASTDEKGRVQIDAAGLAPLARLGGNDYAELGSILTVERPR